MAGIWRPMNIETSSVIPVAVIAAIALFFLRESIDSFRRYRANKLKLSAIKSLLSAECERNNFSIDRMKMAILDMESAIEYGFTINIENPFTSRERLQIIKPSGSVSGFPIPKVHVANLEKFLFEAATLSSSLFSVMRDAQDALTEIQHVRDGLVTYPVEDLQYLDGFLGWAARELEDHIEPIRTLYFYIENDPLTKTRVR